MNGNFYNYNKAKYKTKSLTSDPEYYNQWYYSPYDMRHIIKLVAAYKQNRHTFSARFQMTTSMPYTPIVSGEKDTTYSDPDDPSHERWVPVSGKRNAKRYNPSYRLDLRYTYCQDYEWGSFSWYLELINATYFEDENQVWDYRKDYSSDNPSIEKSGLPLIPNFGIEVKY